MALELFYQDITIDSPEKAARLEAFLEEEPHLTITRGCRTTFNNPDVIRRLYEIYGSKQ